MLWRGSAPRLPSSALRAVLRTVALCTGLRAQCVKGAVKIGSHEPILTEGLYIMKLRSRIGFQRNRNIVLHNPSVKNQLDF